MSTPAPSLRLRFAVLGVIGVLTPLLVLFAVAAWTTEEVRTTSDGVTVTETGGLSGWIPLTVGLLVIPSAVAAWWWAGREVALHERAARAVDDQRRLIENASHGLRTPIAVLLTNADVTLAETDATNEQLRHALTMSRDSAAAMRVVVEGLLGDARTRRMEADQANTDIAAIVTGVCRTHAQAAAERNVTVRRTGPGSISAAVDERAVERAVDALLDNAIRLSPSGSEILIAVSSDGASARVAVTDHGPGIPPEHHREIFGRYWTTDPSRTGIGLAIVAEAARDAFEIEVASPLGPAGGTTISLRLPVATA